MRGEYPWHVEGPALVLVGDEGGGGGGDFKFDAAPARAEERRQLED